MSDPETPSSPREILTRILPYAILVAMTVATFSPALTGQMLRWDDDRIVAENPLVGPPYLSNTLAMFGGIQNEAYQPLHVASYQIDRALWGLDPVGCHVMNLVIYAAALCVLLALFRRLGAERWIALLGMLLFALHPSHVESVAWITGRKDVLSLLFVALAMLLHVRSRRPLDGAHIGSLLLFVMAGLTKTTTLVFPLWLVILDRLLMERSWKETLLRAVAPAVVACALGGLVLHVWQASGLTRDVPEQGSRAVLVLRSAWHYLATVFWPAHLSPIYPIDRSGGMRADALGGLAVLGALLGGALWLRRRNRMAAAGILLYLAALLPVMNLVPLYFQFNDRYLLLPTLGVVPVAWGIRHRLRKKGRGRKVLLSALAILAAACAALSFQYGFAWRSDRQLWEHATGAQPDAYYAWMKMGETLRDEGQFSRADEAYARAVDLQPDLVPARAARFLNCLVMEQYGHAVDVSELDRFSGTVGAYTEAVGDSKQLFFLGLKLHQAGFSKCSFDLFLQAVQSEPRVPDTTILGLAQDFINLSRREEACRLLLHVSEAGKATSGFARLHHGCGEDQ